VKATVGFTYTPTAVRVRCNGVIVANSQLIAEDPSFPVGSRHFICTVYLGSGTYNDCDIEIMVIDNLNPGPAFVGGSSTGVDIIKQ
jgi:hypothetical protein